MEFDFNEMLRNFCSNKHFGVHGDEPVIAFAIDYNNIASALHRDYELNEIHDIMISSNLTFSKLVDDYADYYGEYVVDFTTYLGDEIYTDYVVEFHGN